LARCCAMVGSTAMNARAFVCFGLGIIIVTSSSIPGEIQNFISKSAACDRGLRDSAFVDYLRANVGDHGPQLVVKATWGKDTVLLLAGLDRIVLSMLQRSGGWTQSRVDSVYGLIVKDEVVFLDQTDPIFKLHCLGGLSHVQVDSIAIPIPIEVAKTFLTDDCYIVANRQTRQGLIELLYTFTKHKFIITRTPFGFSIRGCMDTDCP